MTDGRIWASGVTLEQSQVTFSCWCAAAGSRFRLPDGGAFHSHQTWITNAGRKQPETLKTRGTKPKISLDVTRHSNGEI